MMFYTSTACDMLPKIFRYFSVAKFYKYQCYMKINSTNSCNIPQKVCRVISIETLIPYHSIVHRFPMFPLKMGIKIIQYWDKTVVHKEIYIHIHIKSTANDHFYKPHQMKKRRRNFYSNKLAIWVGQQSWNFSLLYIE